MNIPKPLPFSAKTPGQKDYIRAMVEHDVTIVNGYAGTGKTYCALGLALHSLYKRDFEQVILTRPVVECSTRGIGYIKGSVMEKLEVYLLPLKDLIKEFYPNNSHSVFGSCVRVQPLEFMRGMTYNNAFMILDEAQNATYDQFKMYISRMGQNSKIAICGDHRQTDLKQNAMAAVMDKLDGCEGVGLVELGLQDIVRNGIIGRILNRLEN